MLGREGDVDRSFDHKRGQDGRRNRGPRDRERDPRGVEERDGSLEHRGGHRGRKRIGDAESPTGTTDDKTSGAGKAQDGAVGGCLMVWGPQDVSCEGTIDSHLSREDAQLSIIEDAVLTESEDGGDGLASDEGEGLEGVSALVGEKRELEREI